MFEQLEVLSAQRHGRLRLRPVDDYRFAAGLSQVPLVFDELAEAAKHYPIVFPSASGRRPVALLGLERGRNHFVDVDGRWRAGYLPASIRRYPFTLGHNGDGENDRRVVMLDRNAPQLSETQGEPLFDGTATSPAAQRAVEFVTRFQQEADATAARLEPLAHALIEQRLDVRRAQAVARRISGIRVVDRGRIDALDDTTLAAWARSGLLEAVHAHWQSLSNFRRLLGS